MNNPRTSIIIPFYQNEKGILKKAVLSALKQKNVRNYEIIIIDDGSPISACEELSELLKKDEYPIKIIEQSNAGCGAAKNAGLDAIVDQTEYIAILDSDDQWNELHLENAISALEKGYDFYFSDSSRYCWDKTAFANSYSVFQPEKHLIIDKNRKIYEFKGSIFYKLIRRNFISSSVVVYRYKKFRHLRFRKEAPEITLFLLSLFKLSNKIAFSTRIGCFGGKGVNIYDSSSWGSNKHLSLLCNQMEAWKDLLNNFIVTTDENKLIRKRIQQDRNEFIIEILHMIKTFRKIDLRILRRQLKNDFMTYLLFLPSAVKIFIKALNLNKNTSQEYSL